MPQPAGAALCGGGRPRHAMAYANGRLPTCRQPPGGHAAVEGGQSVAAAAWGSAAGSVVAV